MAKCPSGTQVWTLGFYFHHPFPMASGDDLCARNLCERAVECQRSPFATRLYQLWPHVFMNQGNVAKQQHMNGSQSGLLGQRTETWPLQFVCQGRMEVRIQLCSLISVLHSDKLHFSPTFSRRGGRRIPSQPGKPSMPSMPSMFKSFIDPRP